MTTTHAGSAAVDSGPRRNVLSLIALITAILGTIFACLPGALIVGWVLLPIAFILALVSLFLRGRRRGTGIAALIVSVVGTVIGVIVFFAVVADSFDEAFSDEATVEEPAAGEGDADEAGAEQSGSEESGSGDSASEEAADGEPGTRENPYPLGAEISTSDWTVTVDGVDLDATDAVLAENEFNEAPAEGRTYILVDVTAQYTGDDSEGSMPMLSVAYVSPEGNTFDGTEMSAVAPDSFDSMSTLYEGASTSGNIALQVPADGVEDGTLRVSPSMLADDVFVAVG
ncbi:DUF4352 domain-containing protein [Nesterenkonia sp. F]|uniref:DUF4352 domain-containing protein n=1 Tax=Nesterenkonia sp. F TaxID=795955 RepID=UPI000255CCD0|nr:DUF4352 domain-containing protein [Nesterenkonia sp. F]